MAITLIQGCALWAKEHKAGVASIIVPGQYNLVSGSLVLLSSLIYLKLKIKVSFGN